MMDSTFRRRLIEGQDVILEGVAAGRDTGDLLEQAAGLVERCVPGVRVAVLSVDTEHRTLTPAAGRGMPDDLLRAMQGAGSPADPWSAAVASGRAVIGAAASRNGRGAVATEEGPVGCWCFPILLAEEVVAVLVGCTAEAREPTAAERDVFDRCARTMAVVLRRSTDVSHLESVEARYRMLIHEMPLVAYESDRHGQVRLFISPQVESALGLTAASEEATAGIVEQWKRALHPDDREAVLRDWQRAQSEGRTWDAEYRLQRSSGDVIWVRNVDTPVHDEHGRAVGRQGIIFDVTSRVDALNALHAAERRFQTLVERLPAVTYIDGLDIEPSYASPQIERLTGMTPEQWLDEWEEAIHPDDRERVVENYRENARTGSPFEIEFRVVRPDGKVSWVSDRAAAVQSAEGNRLFQGVMLDITAQKQAEMAERESQRRFREMLEAVQLAAVITEVDGTISFCNDHFLALSGYTADEVFGQNWEQLFVPPGELANRTFFAHLRRGHVIPHEITTMRTRSGELRTISWSSTPLRDAAGRVASAASIGEDVTDRIRAERALRESEERRRLVMAEMLRAAEEERTQIATELHDDTVQIMTATLLSLDRLTKAIERGDGDHVSASIAAARSTLAAAVERTRRLMFELRPPLLESAGLDPALRDLAETAAEEAGFDWSASISVGRYPEAVETLAYRTAQEAISNARKHSRARSLHLALAEDAGQLRGEVRDDGDGFDVRQALDRHTKRMHMGLDTMIERVRMAGGEIAVESAKGRGTTVRFRIPAA